MALALEAMPEEKTKATTQEIRERRLQRFPHWEEMEIRLRCRWTPIEVLRWHQAKWPADPGPSERTLWRFLEDKLEPWFVQTLEVLQPGARRVSRLLVLQEQADLIETQKMRLRKMLQFEAGLEGIPIAEIRANVDTLGRLLGDHLRAQQELGLEPKVVTTREPGDDGRTGEGQERAHLIRLVERVVELPSEEFIPALVQLLGPPPIKQARVAVEGRVIESRPAEAGSGAP